MWRGPPSRRGDLKVPAPPRDAAGGKPGVAHPTSSLPSPVTFWGSQGEAGWQGALWTACVLGLARRRAHGHSQCSEGAAERNPRSRAPGRDVRAGGETEAQRDALRCSRPRRWVCRLPRPVLCCPRHLRVPHAPCTVRRIAPCLSFPLRHTGMIVTTRLSSRGCRDDGSANISAGHIRVSPCQP